MRAKEDSPLPPLSTFSRRKADTERLEALLAEWTATIAQARARAKRCRPDTGLEFDRIADELQLLRNEAGAQVMRLKGSTGLGGESLLAELDNRWTLIRTRLRRAEAEI
ncbi:hypothetical protein [Geothrix oryzisoli]|uniref:hypothetical protein n=1 Tax=Geothrix oryzisoli TaxID=2922721 RepID=UPI001FAE053D|nr:hypothetical protein [Geothrix oryzisoli]